MNQREIPIFHPTEKAQWVSEEAVKEWLSYREAVIWCWQNRPRKGLNDPQDQALFARHAGIHAPHMSRYVRPNSKAPMDLPPDLAGEFEAYTGWRGITQYLCKQLGVTALEELMARRAA